MKTQSTLAIIMLALMVIAPGCSLLSPSHNLSPKLDQKIGEINGKQATLENNLNSVHAEIAKLQATVELQGNNNRVQEGYLNISGSEGYLIGVFALVTISMLLFYMYKSSHYQKTTEVLAGQIRAYDNGELRERILATAWKTGVEREIYDLIK